MSLSKYRRMRSFRSTPEPRGKENKTARPTFVIQKHDASHLHYDFRLAMDGVLKSWAVPKGPSMDPSIKRLAMQVEDHPLDYASFEGKIPEGNYGAGDVIVWDNGTYEHLDDDPHSALRKGHLRFRLNGKKLHGAFSLIRTRGNDDRSWLLVKADDEDATDDDVTEQTRSVISRKTLPRDAGQAPAKKRSSSSAKPTAPKAAKLSELSPMLATLVDEPFDRDGWIFEWKWDGYRALASVSGKTTHLESRKRTSFDEHYPAIIKALRGLGHNAVLDGEIVVFDPRGRTNFQLLQNYRKTHEGDLAYVVFDILSLDGVDLRGLPLLRRKELLHMLVGGSGIVRTGEYRERAGKKMFRDAQKKGLEGIIAKNGQSTYQTGKRGPDWLKVKTHQRQEVVIGGFTQPRKSRTLLGAVVVGVYKGDKLVYTGHTGTGFTERTLRDLHAKLVKLKRSTCPFAETPTTNEPATWVKPRLVCEVQFQEWTQDGHMRIPIFKGLREDKDPRDVHREEPEDSGDEVRQSAGRTRVFRGTKAPKTEETDGGLPITHASKVFWPEDGITKGDLARYYDEMADVILPYLRDRPAVLLRHPNGIDGPSFFQKDVGDMPPDWVETKTIYSESADRELRYVICNDRETLLYLVNLGCIEINAWHSKVGSLDRPDYCILDLDPTGIGFDAVIQTAQTIHRILDKRDLPSFCKTSGKRGLHVFIPLGQSFSYDDSLALAKEVANRTHEKLPKITTLARSKKVRGNGVYVDTLQNRHAQTIAAPYSVRPWPGATVSTPLQWSEVRSGLDPADFTIKTIGKRLKKHGDLWRELLDAMH